MLATKNNIRKLKKKKKKKKKSIEIFTGGSNN
jgi:hypothetical protein